MSPHHALTTLGLSHHPFDPDVPERGLTRTPDLDLFCRRVQSLAQRGGFALLTGPPGTGKSVGLRFLATDLRRATDAPTVAIIERPQASLADFYRELGHCYGITLKPHNRWGGANALRTTWRRVAEESRIHAVLLVDEAQDMQSSVLNELRLLNGERLDAGWLVTVVLAGDNRLLERLRCAELAPLASRIRVRQHLEERSQECLTTALRHLLEVAGNAALFADDVLATLVEQSAGNFRTLMHLADQLLLVAMETGAAVIDQHVLLAAAQVEAQPTPGRRSPVPKRSP